MPDKSRVEQWMRDAASEGFDAFNQWVEKLLRFSDVPPAVGLKKQLAEIIASHVPTPAPEPTDTFWHDQYIIFAKQLCEAYGTPTDTFDPNYVGTDELLRRIKLAAPSAPPTVPCPKCEGAEPKKRHFGCRNCGYTYEGWSLVPPTTCPNMKCKKSQLEEWINGVWVPASPVSGKEGD